MLHWSFQTSLQLHKALPALVGLRECAAWQITNLIVRSSSPDVLAARSDVASKAVVWQYAASSRHSVAGSNAAPHLAAEEFDRSNGSVLPWLGFAGAAVAAVCCARLAKADASSSPSPSAPDQFWQAALSAAQLAVSEAFQEALLDLDRAAAQQQQQQQQQQQGPTAPSSSSSKPGRGQTPQKPLVELLDGSMLSVAIPVLPNADIAALLATIDDSIDGLARNAKSSSSSQSSKVLGTSKVVQWESSRTLKIQPKPQQQQGGSHQAAAAGSSTEQLRVQVLIPLQQGSPHESSSASGSSSSSSSGGGGIDSGLSGFGRVSVVKPGGGFTAEELAFLAKLVAAANKPRAPGGQAGGGGWLSGPAWQGDAVRPGPDLGDFGLDNPLGRIFGGLMADLTADLQAMEQQLDREFQHRWGGRWDQQDLDNIEEQIEQSLREIAPPEIITWLNQFTEQQQQQQQQQDSDGGSGSSSSYSRGAGNGSGPSAAAGAPSAPLQQQHQQQALPPWQQPAARAAVQQLQQLGAQVYLPAVRPDGQAGPDSPEDESGWGSLAGYEEQKQALEDFLLLPLKHPEVFERVASRTRKTAQPGSSRPRAVLFEGPPGTGKTSSARLLSRRSALPLVYVPLEALVSKWYGESEQNMAKLFKACEALGGCIIFLDELDSLATSRDRSDMHEASRRLLGVLLREIDGFDNTLGSSSNSSSSSSSSSASGPGASGGSRRSVLIGATNRRQDLDAALLSRFDLSIHFGLPDEPCRTAILQQYAHHLPQDQLATIAAATPGFAGRDLRDVCEQTERLWASRIIRGEVEPEQLPGLEDYLAAVRQRRQGAGRGAGGGSGGLGQHPWAGDGSPFFRM